MYVSRDMYDLRPVSISPVGREVFIKALGLWFLCGKVTTHIVDDGPLNPYFQGGCMSVINIAMIVLVPVLLEDCSPLLFLGIAVLLTYLLI